MTSTAENNSESGGMPAYLQCIIIIALMTLACFIAFKGMEYLMHNPYPK